jgi:hypothetical protein
MALKWWDTQEEAVQDAVANALGAWKPNTIHYRPEKLYCSGTMVEYREWMAQQRAARSCPHPISQLSGTMEIGVFRCKRCRARLGSGHLINSIQEVDTRLRKLEIFTAQSATCCEGCGEWSSEGHCDLESIGSWCARCLVQAGCDPDSGVAEILSDPESQGVAELKSFLTPGCLTAFKPWREAYNQLAKDWPEVFEGYCSEDGE